MKIEIVFKSIFILLFLLSGCAKPDTAVTTAMNNDVVSEQAFAVLKGVSLSPKSFEQGDFLDFLEKTKQTGDVVMWSGDWDEISNDAAPIIMVKLAPKYGYMPFIEVTPFVQSTGKFIRPLDEETKQKYLNSAIAFAQKYQPQYLGFGIETNMFYLKAPNEFNEFVILYNQVYTAVKEVSPNTQVFTVFQLEIMKGHTLWSTAKADQNEAQWFLLDKFNSDIIAFTTYPSLVYKDPKDIPFEYYKDIQSHTTKPIAFTEVGWQSAASPVGWESSEEEQAEFIEIFFRLSQNLDTKVVIWSFMFDPDAIEPFNSMGLIYNNGTLKKSYTLWRDTK